MPTYYARSSGNVNGSIWATTPSGSAAAATFVSGDVLVANSFTVTVNVTTDLGATGEIRNDTTGGATTGGSFTLSNGVTLTANVIVGGATCVSLSSGSATIVGNITAGATGSAFGVNVTTTGTLTITGSLTGGSGANSHAVVMQTNASTVNVTGNVTSGSGGRGMRIDLGTVNITGNVTGAGTFAVNLGASGPTVTITGNVTGGTASGAFGVENSATGNLTVVGVAIGGTAAVGVNHAGGTGSCSVTRARGGAAASASPGLAGSASSATVVEEIEYGDLGASPTSGPVRLSDKTSNVAVMYRFNAAKKILVDTASTSLLPAASNVRSGVSYNAGQTTGTCAVPGAASVLVGVAVDATVGTAAVSSGSIQSACDAALSAFSSGRLANVATVASTGQQLADALSQ
jgi:hypothetical protein